MLNIFKTKKKELLAPFDGEVIELDQVDDPVFAGKMMGEGFAIIPSGNELISPCNGTVVQVFKTKHAIIIKDEFGLELIIHVGLDTVKLKGEGFDVKVTDGQKISKGDLLMLVDLKYIEEQGKATVTPVVITNMQGVTIKEVKTGPCKKGDVSLIFSN